MNFLKKQSSSSSKRKFSLDKFYEDLQTVQKSLKKQKQKTPISTPQKKFSFNNINHKQSSISLTQTKKCNELHKKNINNKSKLQLKSTNFTSNKVNINHQNYSQQNTYVEQNQKIKRNSLTYNIRRQGNDNNENEKEFLDKIKKNLKFNQVNEKVNLQNLLSDDRLSETSDKNNYRNIEIQSKNMLFNTPIQKMKHKKTNSVIEQVEQDLNRYINTAHDQNISDQADLTLTQSQKLMQQMSRRRLIYDWIDKKQSNKSENNQTYLIKELVQQRIQKHKLMLRIIQQFKKQTGLSQIHNLQQLKQILSRYESKNSKKMYNKKT